MELTHSDTEGTGAIKETRQYTLNRKKAVQKKLKDLHITDVTFEWKNEHCCMVDMSVVYFELCLMAMHKRFPESEICKWKPVDEKSGAVIEEKLAIYEGTTKLVHITLYKTKNRIMIQGSHAIEFMDVDFPSLITDIDQNAETVKRQWELMTERSANEPDSDICVSPIAETTDTPAKGPTSRPSTSSRQKTARKITSTPRNFSLRNLLFNKSPSNAVDVSLQNTSLQTQMLEDKAIKLEQKLDEVMTVVADLKKKQITAECTIDALTRRVKALESCGDKLSVTNSDLVKNITALKQSHESEKHRMNEAAARLETTVIAIRDDIEASQNKEPLSAHTQTDNDTPVTESGINTSRQEASELPVNGQAEPNSRQYSITVSNRFEPISETSMEFTPSLWDTVDRLDSTSGNNTPLDQELSVPNQRRQNLTAEFDCDVFESSRYQAISNSSLSPLSTEWETVDRLDDANKTHRDQQRSDTSTGSLDKQLMFDCNVQIIGSSLVKDINANRLYGHQRARVQTLSPGNKTISGAMEYVNIMTITPQVSLFQIGSNDVLTHSPEGIILKVDKLITKTKEKFPRTEVALSTILPRWLKNARDDDEFENRRNIVNNRLHRLSQRHDVRLVRHGEFRPTDTYDGIHLRPHAVARLVRGYKHHIDELLMGMATDIQQQQKSAGPAQRISSQHQRVVMAANRRSPGANPLTKSQDGEKGDDLITTQTQRDILLQAVELLSNLCMQSDQRSSKSGLM